MRATRTRFSTIHRRADTRPRAASEIDPFTGDLLGNFPQAFSHVGLISSAINLERASAARDR